MRTATKRALLSLAVVSGLIMGLIPAVAQTTSLFKGSVDVKNVLAGSAAKEFKIKVTRTSSSQAEAAVNAVLIGVPNFLTLREGRATGWTTTILTPRRVLFTGGSIPASCAGTGGLPTNNTCSAEFSIIADVPVPAQDVSSRWQAFASTNGGDSYVDVPEDGTGALSTVTRVLQVTNLAITGPEGAIDGSVTGQQNNVEASCTIQNVGSGTLPITATLTDASPIGSNQATLAPGATATFNFRFNAFSDVSVNTTQGKSCAATSGAAADTDGFGKGLSLLIQPRPTMDYVTESLSPAATAPLASPSFVIQVNKHRANDPAPSGFPPSVPADTSPKVTLDPAKTTLTILNPEKGNIGPTRLGTPTTIDSGEQEGATLQFAALTIPAKCSAVLTTNCAEDKDYNIEIRVGFTDANGFTQEFQLTDVTDKLRIDAALPTLRALTLTPPDSRCCRSAPAVKNGDTLEISAVAEDTLPGQTQPLPCGSCTVVLSKLAQFSAEQGAPEPIAVIDLERQTTIDEMGNVSATYTGNYHADARSIEFWLIVADTAGNRSDAGTGTPHKSGLVPVDNIAPFIKQAATNPNPSAGGQDAQRTLTLAFSEQVDNFDQGIDGVCPQTDWRMDGNSVLSCARSDNFTGASLIVANQLPDDTVGTTLQYFPQTQLSFHDRVGNAIQAGSTVQILDRIPPKAPSFSTVAGKAADSGDGKYYVTTSFPPVVLTGARAVVPGYTVELWRDVNGDAKLQVEGASADQKIGQEVVQAGQTSVTVTPTSPLTSSETAQTGVQHTVFARALDTATPDPNGTPLDTVKSALVVVDIAAPSLDDATATVNGIDVDLNEVVTGRNSATSWEVLDNTGDIIGVLSVDCGGSSSSTCASDERLLKMSASYCSTSTCATKPVSVQYLFFGVAADRYKDKAGNVIADEKLSVVIPATAP